MRLITIGDAAVETAEGRLDATSPTLFLATCYLAVPAGRRVPREALLELFWPGDEAVARRHRLRTLLHRLKRMGVPLTVTPSHVSIDSAAVEADYHRARNPAAIIANPALVEHVAAILPIEASVPRSLEEWLDTWRQEISREVTRGLVGALRVARDRGDWRLIEQLAERCRVVDPFNEEAHLALAEALCMTGSKERALRLLDGYVAELGEERRLRIPVRMLRERLAAMDEGAPRATEAPFVGRADLRGLLAEAFGQTSKGRGGARIIWGPSGIGKSRLLAEVRREIRMRGGAETGVTCEPGDRVRPLSVLFDLVPKLLDLPGAIGCDPRILEELRALDAERDDLISDDHASGAPARRLRTQSALLELLDAIATEQPLAIWVDDAQWMDPGLLPYWEALLEWSRVHPVLWLFSCRAEQLEDVSRLGLEDLASVLHVGTLDGESSRALIGRLSAALPPQIQTHLTQLGAGSPFVLTELVRHYEETGTVEELPRSVTALIDERLNRLSRTSVRVLQAAGVLGSYATMERLEAVVALPRRDFADAVNELASAAIMSEDADARLRAHALWSEAALARLQPLVSGMLHRHAAERLESELQATPLAALLWESGRHWLAAGDKPRTLAALTRGADHLAANGYTYDAAQVYRRAVELSPDPLQRLQLLTRLIHLLQVSGRWLEVVTAVQEHEQLAAEVDPTYDPHNDMERHAQVAQAFVSGDLAGTMRAALRCVNDPRATPRHRLLAARHCVNMAVHLECRDEIIAAEKIVPELPVTSDEDRRARDVVRLHYCHAIGDREQAAAVARERIAQERSSGDPHELCRGILASDAILHAGAIDEAWALTREAYAVASRHGLTEHMKAALDTLLMMALEFEGGVAARPWIVRLRQLLEGQLTDDRLYRTIFLPMHEAQAAIMDGDGERARAIVPSLESALMLKVPRWRARFIATHLGVALLCGDDETAHELAEKMSEFFDRRDQWLDWPAFIYATYLDRFRSHGDAVTFAQRFVREIRTEGYPPQLQLRDFLRRADASTSATLTFARS